MQQILNKFVFHSTKFFINIRTCPKTYINAAVFLNSFRNYLTEINENQIDDLQQIATKVTKNHNVFIINSNCF